MTRKLYAALDIHAKMSAWTVLIQVVERCHVQLSKPGPKQTRFRRLMLTDSQGTKIPAVIYGNDIRFFHNLLLPYKRYYISNAAVRVTLPQYRLGEYEYSWVINNTTLVEELVEPVPSLIPCAFQTCKFKDLFKFADTENLQNVQAFVLYAFPPKEHDPENSVCRDFIIVNEEKMPMLLKLWNEFDQTEGEILAGSLPNAPMIIAMRIKVTTFHYLSLTSRAQSCILINPPTQEAESFTEWFNTNKEDLKQLVDEKAYKNGNKLLPPPNEADIVSIEAALTSFANTSLPTAPKTAWIKAKPRLIPGQTRHWYTACANCQKSVQAETDWKIKCPACKEDTEVEARCRMTIILSDETGTMNVTIFGLDAEKLASFTATQLKIAQEKGECLDEQIATSVEKHTVFCFVKSYGIDFKGQAETRFNVVKAYTHDEMTAAQSALIYQPPAETISLQPMTSTKVQPSMTKEQLFTPTTKLVLEEIAKQHDKEEKPSSTPTGVKRMLPFTDVDDNPASGISTTPVHAMEDEDSLARTPIKPSPAKKAKDKMKLN